MKLFYAAALSAGSACGHQSTGLSADNEITPHDSSLCEERKWSTPVLLLTPSSSTYQVARSPAVVADAANLYIVGNNLPHNDQPVLIGNTLTTWRRGYGSIGAPASNLTFITPRATLDESGRLHLLWAEPSEHGQTVPRSEWQNLRPSSLWTAAYEPRSGWSAPTRIYEGPINWNWRIVTGPITAGVDGERLIAVPKEDGGVLVVALHNGRWTITSVPVPGPLGPVYVSVLGLRGRRLLAVVDADAAQQQDRNSLFLYRQDGGGAWRLDRRVQRSGTQAAMEVRLLKETNGRVHLVWRQMIRGDYFVVRHIQSEDGGDSWTSPRDLEPGGLIQNVEAAVDGCGRLHVVYEDWSDGSFAEVRIGHAIWDGRWARPERLHSGYSATDLTLAPRTDSSITLAFLGTTANATTGSQWQMMYSTLR